MARSEPHFGGDRGTLSPVDIHVGARARQRRVLLGMTQTNLAVALGLAFQQVHKYERGLKRIAASKLFKLSRALDVPIEYFFEDMPVEVAASSPAKERDRSAEPVSYEPNPMAERETLELVRAYYKIEDADVRKRVYELIGGLGADGV